MNATAAKLANLSPEKQALLAKLLQQKATTTQISIAKRQQHSPSPLSFAQERLWFLAQMEGNNPFYNIAGVVKLTGKLNIAALHQALNEVVRRHEILRTFFGTQAEQYINDHVLIELPIVDLSKLSQDAQSKATAIVSEQEAARGFDLSKLPLLRATLLKQSAEQHSLLMTLHHIISDEWSLNILVRELGEFYASFNAGKPSTAPELTLQYADFADWQRHQIQTERYKNQLTYWIKRLKDAPQLLELPTDKPRPKEQSYQGTTYHFALPTELSQGLQRLAQQQDCTLFMLTMAMFSVLLQRHSGQTDICIGYPIANRNRRDIENLLGFFVNTQVLRSDLANNPRFTDFLAQVKHHILDAQTHQDLPFEQVVEALKPERSLNHTPLFQVMLVLQNAPVASLTLPELCFDIVEAKLDVAKFDLTLTLTQGAQLTGSFNYCTELFSESSIVRLVEHLQCIAESIVQKPQARLSELSLLTVAEQQILLQAPDVDFSTSYSIGQLFEQQAAQHPDTIAVVFEQHSLSYGELNARANQLARYLVAQGVKPDVLVGVCLERSLEMIIALLAILKAGGAYLPLDPDYPSERLAYMLNDAKAALLIAQRALLANLPASNTFCIDSDSVADYASDNLNIVVQPLNLAYVIYTSGSTGNPKGVMVTHHQVIRLFRATETEFQFNEHDVWTMFHSFAFDFSVWEIWGALLYGGRLVVVPYWLSRSPKDFAQLLHSEQVTVLNQTPSAFAQLVSLEQQQQQALACCLRLVIFGGEALDLSGLKSWFFYHGDVKPQLVNMYGITETTVHVTYRPITEADLAYNTSPIGRPIVDLQTYLLDGHYNLCPYVTRGELFVGGEGLARGYLHQPRLTAERFVPNPFGAAGSRLYKSGDLARYLPDGDMDYAGRIDHQVKIRGFRIELGEIEAALLTHPAIKEAVVLARTEGNRKQLVAYLIATEVPKTDELITHLKHRLPDYMLPSAFVYLQEFPLTANGKLNTKALPAPNLITAQADYVAPQTEVEKILTAIWQDLLQLQRIGRQDNFFALGGDSILSIQVVSRARQAGIVFTPKQLFQHQTIAELASVANQVIIQAEQNAVTGFVPLTPIQHWFFEQHFAKAEHWNQALLFKVRHTTPTQLKQALQRLLQHHDALRLQFTDHNGVWQAYQPDTATDDVLFEIDLTTLPINEQATALEREASKQQALLNLNGLLMRAVWFHGAENKILIAIHHLVVDGVSWRILLEDLNTLLSGQELPAKTSAFKQWAELLTERVHSGALAFNRDYWLNPQRQTIQALPVDQLSGVNDVASELALSFSLSVQETSALLTQAPLAYRNTAQELLLTALVQTITTWTKQPCCLIDLEGHGRDEVFEQQDVSRTVGWFTCLFPVLFELANHTPESALINIKEQLRTVPEKGIGYGWLRYVAEGDTAQTLAALPRAEIMFNYLGQLDTAWSNDARLIPLLDGAGENRASCSLRSHEFEIVAQIVAGQLQLTWRYSGQRYQTKTIAALLANYQQHLQALISHCLLPNSGCYTPSDFPLAAITQAELNALNLPAKQVEDLYPLAPLQQGLLFHSLYAPDSGLYCVQLACQLSGALNVELFKQAWLEILARHSTLRACFHVQERPLQQICKIDYLPFVYHDWQDLNPEQQAQDWQTLLKEDAKTPFDFAKAPLMRLGLVRCASEQYYFFWSHHHVLLDGWSNSLIIETVFKHYAALQTNSTLTLPSTRPYRDYIVWLQQQDLAAAKQYWQQQLQDFSTPTVLGIAKTANNQNISDYAKQRLEFSKQQTQQLQDFVKQQQITLNTLMQGAWALLLSRYSNTNDVVFGVTVSGRPAELVGVEHIVGLFINSLPMRVQLSSELKVSDWLKILFAQNLEARRYEYTPLVEIQGWSDVPRGMPLFETLLVFENYPIDSALTGQIACGDLTVSNITTIDYTSYPLTVSALPSEQFKLDLSYDTQRFDAVTISRLLGHLQTLLMAMVENAHAPLNNLSLLTSAERQQILYDWNAATVRDYDLPNAIQQLFEQQAEKTPNALALVSSKIAYNYTQLNAKTNQLAHYLLSLGVQAEQNVAICLPRTVDMVVAVLGVLKAGAAYLPLDPHYPSDRLVYMLQDAEPVVLISHSELLPRLPEHHAQVLLLDQQQQELVKQAETTPKLLFNPHNLAYLIYTSGSTGKPKGVMIEHANALNFIAWARENFSDEVLAQTLFATSLNFDLAVYELFVPLSIGATVQLRQDLLAIRDDDNLSLINTVPSAMTALINSQALPNSVRMINLAGEPLKASLVTKLFEHSQAQYIANLYGPTETTTYSTWTIIPRGQTFEPHIGRAIANTDIYLLDAQLQPVPIGVIGEIYIGGAGVARGYLKRPDLTAERFIKNPFREGRIYKTGDLARWLENGNIEYVGRNDFQVKIRGFRIELGEIENQLLACTNVREAVVIAKDYGEDKRLIAYLVPKQDTELVTEEIRIQLATVLADYMLPSAFVVLPELPLTPNGKLNRAALPAPELSNSKQHIAPRTVTEQTLSVLCTDILQVQDISVTDDFFALGGHSLTATQFIARINKTFAIELAIKILFDTGSIEKLAEQVDLALWLKQSAHTLDNADFEEIEL